MLEKKGMDRRNFIKNSALGVVGAGMMVKEPMIRSKKEEKTEPKKIKSFRILGRTGFKVSDIGGGYLNDAGVINAMLDAGVNYIDTAESYGNQRVIGSAIQNRDRKKLFITSKLEIKKDVSKEGFLKRTRKCLQELQTDYIDCMMMHSAETVNVLKTQGFHRAMDQLKREGRVRFVGVSNHGSFWFRNPEETMEKVLLAAATDGRFDVILLAYNFLKMDMGEHVLRVCKEKNIGTALMKTTPVVKYYGLKARIEELKKQGKKVNEFYLKGLERFKQKAEKAEGFIKKYNLKNPEEIRDASIRFVLGNPDVSTVCCSMKNFDDVERFVSLSGTGLSYKDKKKLTSYEKSWGELYCRHACGICETSCPNNVPVNTIMRYNHYFDTQAREKYAMIKYAEIPGANAKECYTCTGICESACPYNLPVQGMLVMAHKQLSFA